MANSITLSPATSYLGCIF